MFSLLLDLTISKKYHNIEQKNSYIKQKTTKYSNELKIVIRVLNERIKRGTIFVLKYLQAIEHEATNELYLRGFEESEEGTAAS